MFAENLRAERARKNISQQELADKTDISRGTIANYESGTTEPSGSTIVKIAKALGISITTLLE